MCTRMFMMTKTLIITEDAYEMLKRQKGEGESFSEVIKNLAAGKGDASKFYGAWKGIITDQEAQEMKQEIEEADLRSTKAFLKRLDT